MRIYKVYHKENEFSHWYCFGTNSLNEAKAEHARIGYPYTSIRGHLRTPTDCRACLSESCQLRLAEPTLRSRFQKIFKKLFKIG